MLAIGIVTSVHTSIASAEISKQECVDAHSRGQDAKEQGKLSLARKLFLTCAQSACPTLVQSDCARFADDLGHLQPNVSFVARDGLENDLPDTSVYVDDVLVATRLDGSTHDIDPGKHAVRFSSGGKDQTITIVIGSGEKGRTVLARFGSSPPAVPAAQPSSAPAQPRTTTVTTHRLGPKVLLVGGATLAIGGGVLAIFERTRVPANCSTSTYQCAAPPGDPSFDAARQAMRLGNYGWIGAGVGAAALATGIVWYVASGKTTTTTEHLAIAPWLTPTSGGLALNGSL